MIIAAVSLLLAIPFILLAALCILLIDFQNPFFLQSRVGRHKKSFTIIKLRTMKNNNITAAGAILRRTGIDELPQLLHILFAQMSFVGPRPLTTCDIDRLGWNDAYHADRWNVRPGLTGLAQLSPVCNKKMSWFLDKKYIRCHGVSLDLKILLTSFLVLVAGKTKATKWIYARR